MLSVLLASALWLQTAGGRGQAAPPAAAPADWVVVVSAAVYQPDGNVLTETSPLPATGAGLIHVFARRSVCEPAVAGAVEPTDAGFGWRVSSAIVSRSEREVVVSLDWRRMWDGGKKIANGPGGTAQLALHPGDRIPLDHITNASPRPDCRAVGLGLDVRLARAASSSPTPTSEIPIGATAGGAKPVDAELWLTHTLPSGSRQTLHQIVRIPAAGGQFGFAPTLVETAGGNRNVQMSGSIDRYRTPSGTEFLVLSLSRLVMGEGLPATGVMATTRSVQPMPLKPEDVLAFEMPGTVGRGGGGRGGGGAARGAGGGAVGSVAAAGGSGTTMVARGGSGDPQTSGGTGGARAGGGGRGGGAVAQMAPLLLEGHQFALTMRIAEVK